MDVFSSLFLFVLSPPCYYAVSGKLMLGNSFLTLQVVSRVEKCRRAIPPNTHQPDNYQEFVNQSLRIS